jgi:hypothetical protein
MPPPFFIIFIFMKFFLFLLYSLTSSLAFSQEIEKVFPHLPLRNGIVYEELRRLNGYYIIDGLSIMSDNDSCFASEDGEVVSIFNLRNSEIYPCWAILLKTKNQTFVTFSNLSRVYYKKGELVIKGAFLGLLLKPDEGVKFELLFLLSDKKGNFSTRKKIFARLEKSNNSCYVNPNSYY